MGPLAKRMKKEKTMAHHLPPLRYAFDDLEPWIDARTMEIHYGKHHNAYVTNLNKALDEYEDLRDLSMEGLLGDLDRLPETIRTTVRNHGGGHHNHALFWSFMKKGGGGEPRGRVADAIRSTFGSFEAFQARFSQAAIGRFGSGWAWLFVRQGRLLLDSTANQDTPVMNGGAPVLGLDVWEHAYYLKYQNRRADYVNAWWNVVDWDRVEELYRLATK